MYVFWFRSSSRRPLDSCIPPRSETVPRYEGPAMGLSLIGLSPISGKWGLTLIFPGDLTCILKIRVSVVRYRPWPPIKSRTCAHLALTRTFLWDGWGRIHTSTDNFNSQTILTRIPSKRHFLGLGACQGQSSPLVERSLSTRAGRRAEYSIAT